MPGSPRAASDDLAGGAGGPAARSSERRGLTSGDGPPHSRQRLRGGCAECGPCSPMTSHTPAHFDAAVFGKSHSLSPRPRSQRFGPRIKQGSGGRWKVSRPSWCFCTTFQVRLFVVRTVSESHSPSPSIKLKRVPKCSVGSNSQDLGCPEGSSHVGGRSATPQTANLANPRDLTGVGLGRV